MELFHILETNIRGYLCEGWGLYSDLLSLTDGFFGHPWAICSRFRLYCLMVNPIDHPQLYQIGAISHPRWSHVWMFPKPAWQNIYETSTHFSLPQICCSARCTFQATWSSGPSLTSSSATIRPLLIGKRKSCDLNATIDPVTSVFHRWTAMHGIRFMIKHVIGFIILIS